MSADSLISRQISPVWMWWGQALASRKPYICMTGQKWHSRDVVLALHYIYVGTYVCSIALGGSRQASGCQVHMRGDLRPIKPLLRGCQVTRWAHTSLSLAVTTKISGQSNLGLTVTENWIWNEFVLRTYVNYGGKLGCAHSHSCQPMLVMDKRWTG
jgi:hypothetical protein